MPSSPSFPLSVLIPTYCYDCRPLVKELSRMARQSGMRMEVLVADDGSPEAFRRTQREIDALPDCRYMERAENRGRAATRNELARAARGSLLLFMDADARPVGDAFLADYLRASTPENVVYGGMQYPAELPPPGRRLRHLYGIRREQLSARVRQAAPYARFNSICFLISRRLFLTVGFDEQFVSYGHEDTYFGLCLQQKGIPMAHIDRPVLHLNTDADGSFLRKTRSALRALVQQRRLLVSSSGLLRLLGWLESCGLSWLPVLFFRLFRRRIERRITNVPHPSFFLFSLYRAGYLCAYARKERRRRK